MRKDRTSLVETLALRSASRKELARQLAQIGLGIVGALEKSETTIDQAEMDLLNLDNYVEIKKRRLDKALLEFFEWGMQLEDVAEMVPSQLPHDYAKMRQLARRVLRNSLPVARILPRNARRLRKSA